MTVGSLFTGIGGLDLGFERAGFQVRWQVENDEYCNKVLQKHWPSVPRYSDVKDLKGDELEKVDVIIGGFPCQPVSCAGKRKGQEDERWLWPEFHRIIRKVRPRFVVVENVPGLLNLGFGDVLRDLAQSGYDAEWDCIPATAVGAPHLRYRIFIIAYLADSYTQRLSASEEARGFSQKRQVSSKLIVGLCELPQQIADSNSRRFEGQNLSVRQSRQIEAEAQLSGSSPVVSDSSRIREGSGNGGGSRSLGSNEEARIFRSSIFEGAFADECWKWWSVEPEVGRVANGVPARVHRLRCLGNAVVPQVAEYIARLVLLKAQSEIG